MKKLNDFWFGVLLVLSIFIVAWSFKSAEAQRISSTKLGGEVFTIALPLMITKWKLWTAEQEKKSNRMKIKQLSHEKMQELKNM